MKRKIIKRIYGDSVRHRLSVFRSLKHIYAQIVDDSTGRTLVSVSTLSKELMDKSRKISKTEQAKKVGEAVARNAIEKNIKSVVFDRGERKYHGRLKSLAEAARQGGLKF
ncbi:MAG: 50S ribosomal protein L18 [Elusimicrobia bacterium]|nr:50S ribosomal protein L18 [Elusimicrobiota bacterium]